MVGDDVLTASKATGRRSGADGFESRRCNFPKSFTRMEMTTRRLFQSASSTHSTIGGLVAMKEVFRENTA